MFDNVKAKRALNDAKSKVLEVFNKFPRIGRYRIKPLVTDELYKIELLLNSELNELKIGEKDKKEYIKKYRDYVTYISEQDLQLCRELKEKKDMILSDSNLSNSKKLELLNRLYDDTCNALYADEIKLYIDTESTYQEQVLEGKIVIDKLERYKRYFKKHAKKYSTIVLQQLYDKIEQSMVLLENEIKKFEELSGDFMIDKFAEKTIEDFEMDLLDELSKEPIILAEAPIQKVKTK